MEFLIFTYSLLNCDCKNLHVYFGPLHQSLGLHIFQIGSIPPPKTKKRTQEFLLNISDTFTASHGKTGPHFEDIITWHDISQLTTLSKQVTTSPPWNGWRLVHSNNSVWASQWLVTLCTFYRQILSLTYSFFLWNFRPRLARLYL